jgi:hypothetical protein
VESEITGRDLGGKDLILVKDEKLIFTFTSEVGFRVVGVSAKIINVYVLKTCSRLLTSHLVLKVRVFELSVLLRHAYLWGNT